MHRPALTPTPADSLDVQALRAHLEEHVDRVLSVRRSVLGPARELEAFDRAAQERFLSAVSMICGTSVELAYNFCMFGVPSLGKLEVEAWDHWVLHLMEKYDEGGVMAAIVAMQKVEEFVQAYRCAKVGLPLDEVRGVLERFLCGLQGRALKVVADEESYTDTEVLYLSERVTRFASREENFRLFKATAVHLWAQTWYGTWQLSVAERVACYPDPERALRLFHALERMRLDACLARELPGLHRQLLALGGGQGAPLPDELWEEAAQSLAAEGCTAEDSHRLLPVLYQASRNCPHTCYQGRLFPDRTEAVISQRLRREKEALRRALRAILEDLGPHARDPEAEDPGLKERQFELVPRVDDDPGDNLAELRLQGEPIPPHPEVQRLLDSIVQDLGAVPPDYLVPAGTGSYRPSAPIASKAAAVPVSSEGVHLYDEWDYHRLHYRKDWCVLYEKDLHPVVDDFVERTLGKHRRLLKHLCRAFEALRGENKLLKREPEGSDIDLDATVEAYTDLHSGREASDRLFTRPSRLERNIAAIFMVDVSGSTKGWINEIEREALVLLCESLEKLGDRYAIYGFSGLTHRRCELYRIKRFEEPYSAQVRARISGIRPRDYTRMGVIIRHLTRLLLSVETRTRLLITLSDGRPDDQDGYRGAYGIEDTRQALLEARHQGVHPFCITIDEEALDYLPHMYGPASFTVVNQVHKLPLKVSDIYRRITT